MKIKLTLLIAMLFFVITCSIPSEPGKNINIEDYKLSITFERDRYKTEDIEQIDALMGDDSTTVQVKSMKINAFINNQIENAKVYIEVKISDQADTVSGELLGDIKPLIELWLIENPAGTQGYKLNDPAVILENPGLVMDSEGLSLSEDVINTMLHSDTYIKSTLTIYPDGGGQIILDGEDYVEAQVTLTGHLMIKLTEEE